MLKVCKEAKMFIKSFVISLLEPCKKFVRSPEEVIWNKFVSGNDIEQTANTYKLMLAIKRWLKLASQNISNSDWQN